MSERIVQSNALVICSAILCLITSFLAPAAYGQGFRATIADTWLDEASGAANHGSDQNLKVKNKPAGSFRAIFQYDLSGLPINANVTEAEVWFWVNSRDNSGDPVNIYRITDSWSENTATWNNTANDYDAATIVGSFVPDSTGWQKIDIINLTQSWVCQPINDYGLMLIATSSDTESRYASRESGNAGKRSRLKLKTSGTNTCITGVHHFVISHDAYGIHCLAETITVRAEDAAANPVTTYGQQVTLDTQSGNGTWTLVTGSGTFADATADDGIATYDWAAGESEAVFSLSYAQGASTVDVDVYQTSDTLIRDDDTEGNIEFSASGFTLTAAPLSNPPPGLIVPFNATQVAGTDFGIYLTAYGETATDPVCGIIETYTGPQNLKFWFDRVDPIGGTIATTIDGNAIGLLEGAASNQAVTFANGQAAVTGKYKDAGSIRIRVKDDNLAHPDLPTGIRGATTAFVVKPANFTLANIEDSGGNANPAAADASGAVFVAAGDPFSVTVTARDAEGDITPNFGQENAPETVRLTSSLVDPVAGNDPGLSPALGFGPFSAGSAIGTTFTWPEVGIIRLQPSVGDGSYLSGGDVTGLASGNVGRFIPHHFATSVNTPLMQTQCSGGGFTYIGESFGFSTAPIISFTALSTSGSVTQNYTGSFFKTTNLSLQNRDYTAAGGNLDLSGLPATSGDPVIADTAGGTGTLLFSSGTGISFLRTAAEAPFDADISLSIDVIDSDGVTTLVTPVTIASIPFDMGPNMRFGRVRLINNIGSERVNLPVPMRAEYFFDAATGFVANTDDSCAANVSLSLGNFTENLLPTETCVLDTGSPGASSAGCAAAGPAGQRYLEPPLGGDFNLFLRAPGAGFDGSVDVTADVPFWLEFDWDAASPGLEDPTGTATFGIYDGDNKRIYTRELY